MSTPERVVYMTPEFEMTVWEFPKDASEMAAFREWLQLIARNVERRARRGWAVAAGVEPDAPPPVRREGVE